MALRNIIIVNDHAYVSGGQPKVAIESALGLAAAGYAVFYFASTGPIDPRMAAAGITVHCLDQPDLIDDPNKAAAMLRGLWNKRAAAALADLLAQFDPADSLVHCHGCDKGLSPAIGPVLTKSGLPLVYTMHNFSVVCPNGVFFDYQKQEICTRKPLGAACLTTNCDSRSMTYKFYRVGRQLVTWGPGGLPRNLQHVILLSNKQASVMADHLPDTIQVHAVPDPIDAVAGPKVDAATNGDFIAIGRLNGEKGAASFAAASAQAGVHAVFVGDGEDRDKVLAANPAATLTGWVTPDEIPALLGRARALVLPSICYETFGMVAYEALARGVPVIVGSWNAASEGVRHQVSGLVYDKQDQLAAMLELAKDDALIAELSQNAYDHYWQAPLGLDHHIKALETVYAQVMAAR